jgi:hypothetical protein
MSNLALDADGNFDNVKFAIDNNDRDRYSVYHHYFTFAILRATLERAKIWEKAPKLTLRKNFWIEKRLPSWGGNDGQICFFPDVVVRLIEDFAEPPEKMRYPYSIDLTEIDLTGE